MKTTQLSLLLICVSACSSSPQMSYKNLIVQENPNGDSKKILNKQELEEDKNELIYSLHTVYSGRHGLPKEQYDALLAGVESLQGALTPPDFCHQLASIFAKVRDNHLQSLYVPDEGDPMNCSGELNRKPGPQKLHVGKNYFQSKSKFWDVRLKRYKKTNALLISITEFANRSDPGWNGFLDKVKASLPKAKFIILDMRGNGGGDDSMGGWLSNLLAGVNLANNYSEIWWSLTPESMQSWANTTILLDRYAERFHMIKNPTARTLIAEYLHKRDLAIQGKLTLELALPPGALAEQNSTLPFDPKRSVEKPIYILMDNYCGSSCESTIDDFELNTYVKKVGENTAGAIHFANIGWISLKNSGVIVQEANSFNSYKDGRFLEKIGITPEIAVEPGKDALDYAVKDYFAH